MVNILKHGHAWRFSSVPALFVLATITGLLLPPESHADGSAGALMEEMMVIARKKGDAEAAQEVPIAITTFSANQIDALFVQRLDDLSYMAPNVQLEQVGTFPSVQNFSIRGQGINSSIPSVDPTVGTFVDGVYIGTTYGVVIDMFDVENIEMLRGPQGILFGRNVTGGAVLVRTARPDGEFGIKLRAQGTNNDRYGIAGAIEGALVPDVLAGKIVAYYDQDDGYFDNTNPNPTWPSPPAPVPQPALALIDGNQPSTYENFFPATGRNVGEMETYLVRPTLVWNVTDKLDMTLIGEFGHSEGDGAAWADVTAQRGSALTPGDSTEFATNSEEMGTSDIDWTQLTFELNWDIPIGDGTITNITGWRDVEAFSITDIDGTFLPIFTASGSTEQDQISTELRYFGTFLNNWDVTVGLYYFTQDIGYREGRFIGGGAGANFSGPPLSLPFPGFNLALGGDMDHDTWALFWNNDIRLGETVTLTAGIRYTDEEKKAQIVEGGCIDLSFAACSFSDLTGDWQNLTPRLGADWQFNENAMLYGFWAQGVRSGGFNFRNARPDVIPPGPTKEETQNSFEVGIKSDLLDNRLRANVALFLNKIDDMQRELNMGDPVVVVLQGTINAGDVTIKGVEFDFVALLAENFSIDASLGIQSGKYDSVNPDWAGNDPTGTPFLGPDLPRLAPWNYSIGATYDIFIGNAGLITLRANYAFRDSHPYNDSNTEVFDSQRRASASINYTSPDDHWRVSLWGKNLKDEANWGNLTSIAGLYTAGPMQKGRDYGLTVTYGF